jgi:hypothetical protein
MPWFITAVAGGVIVFVVVGVFGAKLLADALHKKDNSVQIVSEVKQIFPYLLPSEAPTVATITDINKLSDQEFFRNAQNGDSVLVFPSSKIAIIYRHDKRAVINFGPTSVQAAPVSTPLVTPTQVTPARTPAPTPMLTPGP